MSNVSDMDVREAITELAYDVRNAERQEELLAAIEVLVQAVADQRAELVARYEAVAGNADELADEIVVSDPYWGGYLDGMFTLISKIRQVGQ